MKISLSILGLILLLNGCIYRNTETPLAQNVLKITNDEAIQLKDADKFSKKIETDYLHSWSINPIGSRNYLDQILYETIKNAENTEKECKLRIDKSYPENLCDYFDTPEIFVAERNALDRKEGIFTKESMNPSYSKQRLQYKEIDGLSYYVHTEPTIGDCTLVRYYETYLNEGRIIFAMNVHTDANCNSDEDEEVDLAFDNLDISLIDNRKN